MKEAWSHPFLKTRTKRAISPGSVLYHMLETTWKTKQVYTKTQPQTQVHKGSQGREQACEVQIVMVPRAEGSVNMPLQLTLSCATD